MSSVIPLQTVAFIDAYEKSDMRDGQARCDRSTTFRELRGGVNITQESQSDQRARNRRI